MHKAPNLPLAPAHRDAVADGAPGLPTLPQWVFAAPEPDRSTNDTETQQPLAGDLLNLAETAYLLRLSTRTVSRLIQCGTLPALRLGRSVRVSRSDLMQILGQKPRNSATLDACRE